MPIVGRPINDVAGLRVQNNRILAVFPRVDGKAFVEESIGGTQPFYFREKIRKRPSEDSFLTADDECENLLRVFMNAGESTRVIPVEEVHKGAGDRINRFGRVLK